MMLPAEIRLHARLVAMDFHIHRELNPFSKVHISYISDLNSAGFDTLPAEMDGVGGIRKK